jgi:hypothetical protein
MKITSKLITIACMACIIFLNTTAKAQTTAANAWQIGIGVETADPVGSARKGADFILGGTIRLQYGLSDNFALTLTSGAYHFFPIYQPGTHTRYQSYGQIPIKAGFKKFFNKNIYFGAEAGLAIEEDDSGQGPTRFLLSPALGYATTHWDVGIHYDRFSSATQDSFGLIGLRLAYGFGL